jgi:tripartite-type tricarboxylate transporter receptor subunit TctC
MTQRLLSDGSQPPDERMTPEQFKAYLAREYEEVERQVKHLNVKFF